MIEFWIVSAEGKLNDHLLRMSTGVKKAPYKLSKFMLDVIDKALDIALKEAKHNVLGGVIGGNPRLDDHQGKLADSIKKEVVDRGNIIEGSVGIPEGSFENYIGYRQETGWDEIVATGKNPMRFMLSSGLIVDAWKTSGYPASGWLMTTWQTTESKMESYIRQQWNKPDVPQWILGAEKGISGMASFIKSRYGV
jgi:hypothetical protein